MQTLGRTAWIQTKEVASVNWSISYQKMLILFHFYLHRFKWKVIPKHQWFGNTSVFRANLKTLSISSFYTHYSFPSWGSSFLSTLEMASGTDLAKPVSHQSLMLFTVLGHHTHRSFSSFVASHRQCCSSRQKSSPCVSNTHTFGCDTVNSSPQDQPVLFVYSNGRLHFFQDWCAAVLLHHCEYFGAYKKRWLLCCMSFFFPPVWGRKEEVKGI